MNKKSTSFYIYGKHAVSQFLETHPELVRRVYIKDTVPETEVSLIRPYLTKHTIPLVREGVKKFVSLVGDVAHQGVVAEVSEFPYTSLDTIIETTRDVAHACVLVLDQLEDPHNVGAIIRSAVASGVSAVVMPKFHQSPVNGTVFKTSAGTISAIPVVLVSNVSYAIGALKEAGFWVAGLAAGADTYWDADLKGKMAFVVGSEGEGVRSGVANNCDLMVSIPMADGVESLNASVAASLVLYEWRRQARL